MRFTISEEVAQKLLETLAQRPYVEVAGVIAELQQDLKPVVTPANEEEDEESAA